MRFLDWWKVALPTLRYARPRPRWHARPGTAGASLAGLRGWAGEPTSIMADAPRALLRAGRGRGSPCSRDRGDDTIEVTPEAEQRWTRMVDRNASKSNFSEISYYFGTNIPGKPRKYLLNSGGRPKLFAVIAEVIADDYKAFRLGRLTLHAPSSG